MVCRSLAGSHAVTNSSDRAYETASGGIVAQLAAKVTDVDVYQVVITHPVRAPHGGHQLGSAEDDPRVAGERGEDVELGAGQRDIGAADGDLSARGVNSQVADGPYLLRRPAVVDFGGAGSRSAHHRLDPGRELARA